MKKWWEKAVGALVLSVVLLSILVIPNTWAMLPGEPSAQLASPAASPRGQEEPVARQGILQLRGEGDFAKLLEFGFSQEEVDQIRQKAGQIRQYRGGAAPMGPGGDTEYMWCGVGQSGVAVFEVALGPWTAAFRSTKGWELPYMVGQCEEAWCAYIHWYVGQPDRSLILHAVWNTPWAEHYGAWCL